jgi:hypothetical protein
MKSVDLVVANHSQQNPGNDDDQQQNEEKNAGSETSEQEVVTHRNYSFSGVKDWGAYNENVMKF